MPASRSSGCRRVHLRLHHVALFGCWASIPHAGLEEYPKIGCFLTTSFPPRSSIPFQLVLRTAEISRRFSPPPNGRLFFRGLGAIPTAASLAAARCYRESRWKHICGAMLCL